MLQFRRYFKMIEILIYLYCIISLIEKREIKSKCFVIMRELIKQRMISH